MENAKQSFGINLRRAIDNQGLTYSAAADRIGVSLSFLNQLMAGKSGPSIEMIYQIRDALKCSVAELFGETPGSRLEALGSLVSIMAALNEDEMDTLLDTARALRADAAGIPSTNEFRDKSK